MVVYNLSVIFAYWVIPNFPKIFLTDLLSSHDNHGLITKLFRNFISVSIFNSSHKYLLSVKYVTETMPWDTRGLSHCSIFY